MLVPAGLVPGRRFLQAALVESMASRAVSIAPLPTESGLSAYDDIADIDIARQYLSMKKVAIALAGGILLGWFARWFVDTDSCYDAGGVWESRGGYCFGATSADPTGR